MTLCLELLGVLGLEDARRGEEALDVLEELDGLLCIALVSRGDGVLAEGDGRKALTEDIAAPAQATAVLRHLEEHTPIRVEAVALDELDGRTGGLEPLGALLDLIVGEGGDEGEAALEPYALGRVHERTVTIYAGVDAAVLAVEPVLEPEGENILHQVLTVAVTRGA